MWYVVNVLSASAQQFSSLESLRLKGIASNSFNKVFGSIKDNPSAYKSIWWLLQMHNALSSPGNLTIELGACLRTILMVFLLKFPFSIVNLLYSSFHSSTFVLLLTDAVSIVGCVVHSLSCRLEWTNLHSNIFAPHFVLLSCNSSNLCKCSFQFIRWTKHSSKLFKMPFPVSFTICKNVTAITIGWCAECRYLFTLNASMLAAIC